MDFIRFNIDQDLDDRIQEWCSDAEMQWLTLKLKLLFSRAVVLPLQLKESIRSEIFTAVESEFKEPDNFYGPDALVTVLSLTEKAVRSAVSDKSIGENVYSRALLDYVSRFTLTQNAVFDFSLVKILMQLLESATLNQGDNFGLSDVTK